LFNSTPGHHLTFTLIYCHLQSPCFIGFYYIPVATAVPSIPPSATGTWGLFWGLFASAELSNPHKTTPNCDLRLIFTRFLKRAIPEISFLAAVMKLNDTLIRNAKPAAKPFKIFDGNGFYLLVNPNGSRWWKLKYRFAGVEKLRSLGVYPEVSLKLARQRREEARGQRVHGVAPSAERKAAKRGLEHTFESVAREWWTDRRTNWTEEYAKAVIS
jgi:Arm DNA-binding domain